MITKTSEELHRLHEDVLKAAGTPDDIATVVADILVGAHLAGHDSHGIQHLPHYVQEVEAGRYCSLCASRDRLGERQRPIRPRQLGLGTLHGALSDRCRHQEGEGTRSCVGRRRRSKPHRAAWPLCGNGRGGGRGFDGLQRRLFTEHANRGAFRRAQVAPRPEPNRHGVPDFPRATRSARLRHHPNRRRQSQALAAAKGVEVPPGCIIDKDGNPTTDPNVWPEGRRISIALRRAQRVRHHGRPGDPQPHPRRLRELRRNRARRPAHANRRLDDGCHRQRRVFDEGRIRDADFRFGTAHPSCSTRRLASSE